VRVLFATTAGVGHFRPLVPFIRACRRAGHEVLVAGQAGIAATVAREDLPFWPLAEPTDDEVTAFRVGQDGLPAMEAAGRAVTGLYVGLYARSALAGMTAAMEEWRPDAVVREGGEFSSVIAADRLGVPYARIGLSLSAQLESGMLALADPALDELAVSGGSAPNLADRASGEWCLTLAPPSFDGAAEVPGVWRFRQTANGGAGAPPEVGGDPAVPLVYLSFGTEVPSPTRDYYPRLYLSAVDVLNELGVRVLVTIGDRADPAALEDVPDSVRVERWVSQTDVMPHTAAMVGHGGAGSTLLALAAGVPMALVPSFADQPANARRVAELGAGVTIEDPESLSGLGPAVRELLDNPAYRDRARAIADEINGLPSVDEAVEVLARLAAGGRR
jgi:UDP:flavonoid glycosyltransferase YjiC (YdhE family)